MGDAVATEEMTAARALVLGILHGLAPEVDAAGVDDAGPLQEQFDLDSIGFLELVTAICDRAGVDIPERDYPQVATLDGCVRYLATHGPG